MSNINKTANIMALNRRQFSNQEYWRRLTNVNEMAMNYRLVVTPGLSVGICRF